MNWLKKQRSEYSFNIEAWWKNDLEAKTMEYGASLQSILNPEISQKLGLDSIFGSNSSIEYHHLREQCRAFTIAQIEKNAKSKFIPDLYVDRDLQDALMTFHGSVEQTRAHLKPMILGLQRALTGEVLEHISKLKSEVRHWTGENPWSGHLLKRELRTFCLEARKSCNVYLHGVDRIKGSLRRIDKDSIETFFRSMVSELLPTCRRMLASFTESIGREHTRIEQLSELVPLRNKVSELLLGNGRGASIRGMIEDVEEICYPGAVVIDRAGGGKTNLLCRIGLTVAEQAPTLLIFGRDRSESDIRIVDYVSETLSRFGVSDIDDCLDRIGEHGHFFHIMIDGINECYDSRSLNNSIGDLLVWAQTRKVRVTISCRDIYWKFFDSREWMESCVGLKGIGSLSEFSCDEYLAALPLYLRHYNISCRISAAAEDALSHPLMMRFFCEAFGDPSGDSVVELGDVKTIRLKELFDKYLEKKSEQIRIQMGLYSAHEVISYLVSIAGCMFQGGEVAVQRSHLMGLIDDRTPVSEQSIYFHLLNEDIIIEERPEGGIEDPTMSFVYEAFMEYIIARSIVGGAFVESLERHSSMFSFFSEFVEKFPNCRGVVEYIGLFLCGSSCQSERSDGERFLCELAESGDVEWASAFWSIVEKLRVRDLTFTITKQICKSAMARQDVEKIGETIAAIAKRNGVSKRTIAVAIVMSWIFDPVISWSEYLEFSELTSAEVDEIAERLLRHHRSRKKSPSGELWLLNAILRNVRGAFGGELESAVSNLQLKYMTSFNTLRSEVVKLFVRLEPSSAVFLLNGIVETNSEFSRICADRIRFVEKGSRSAAKICKIVANGHGSARISRLLKSSAAYLLSEE